MRSPFLALIATLSLVQLAQAQLPPAQTGEFYVSDFGNDRIVVYSPSGTPRRSFTAPGLNGPRGILFMPDWSFLVASELSDAVYRFDVRERFQGLISHAELDGPTGMALGPSGELYVSSFNNARICVFDTGGNFQRSFGTPPGASPQFSTPNCVAFDSQGFIYSSSAATGRVFKWSPGEQFLFSFTAPPPSSLLSPMGIARDANDFLYVAGGSSHNIVLFNSNGTYLGEISHPDLTGPQGVAFDDRGHLFSPSFFQDRIVEFDAGGAYVQTITAGGLNVPRSITFRPRKKQKSLPTYDVTLGAADTLAATAAPPLFRVAIARLVALRALALAGRP